MTMSNGATTMTTGTKVWATYEFPFKGEIVKPIHDELPLPAMGWYIVQHDKSSARSCIHESMLAERN